MLQLSLIMGTSKPTSLTEALFVPLHQQLSHYRRHFTIALSGLSDHHP